MLPTMLTGDGLAASFVRGTWSTASSYGTLIGFRRLRQRAGSSDAAQCGVVVLLCRALARASHAKTL
eukprot:15485105-Alexandrium_andersonii.AAC.1